MDTFEEFVNSEYEYLCENRGFIIEDFYEKLNDVIDYGGVRRFWDHQQEKIDKIDKENKANIIMYDELINIHADMRKRLETEIKELKGE